MIEEKVRSALFTACKVQRDQTVVIGFSGGADSQCLLHLLAGLPVKMVAAYYDHGLRPESTAEAALCRGIAKELGVQFIAGKGDVRGFAADHRLSIEEAARVMRYRFLFDTARLVNADAVATAHHADDQVETILMHLMRGAGADGLSGMRYRSPDPLGESRISLIRPLLGIWRDEILHYCQENHLEPLQDATNQERTYFRNRIRMELIPELETYNRQVRQHLWQTAAILEDENDALDTLAQEAASAVMTRRGEHWVELDQGGFSRQPLWLQRRIFRRVLFEFKKSLRDVDFTQMERALDFLAHPQAGKTCQLSADLEILKLSSERVILAQRDMLLVDLWPQVESVNQTLLEDQAELDLPGGWKFTVVRAGISPSFPMSDNPWKAILDTDRLSGALSLGKRENGDVFEPYGMAGEKIKVGDFFTNVHLPSRARAHWPIIRCGDLVVWIPGYRLAEFCKVTTSTKNVFQLELIQK